MNIPSVSAIILAAGLSSRMKRFKPLMPLGRRTMVETAIALFRKNQITDIIVVTGHRSSHLKPLIIKSGARPVFNPDFKQGMLSSIRTGVKHINCASQGFFLLPVDIPAVRPRTVRQLINAFDLKKSNIIIPAFSGQTGHPPLIPSALKNDIFHLKKNETLRDLLFASPDRVKYCPVFDRGILMDADDINGYKKILKKHARLHVPDMEECMAIINGNLPGENSIRNHLAHVSMTALKIANAVEEPLDPDLVIAAALLHDIKRKEKNHAHKGAVMVESLGFHRVADIIERHMDLDYNPDSNLSEKEIVYFADKLCNGNGLDLNYHKRFAIALKKSPWAMASISKRYEHTRQIHARIELSARKMVDKILCE